MVFTYTMVQFFILTAVVLAVQVTVGDVQFVFDYCSENLSAFVWHTKKDVKLGVSNPVTLAERSSVAVYLSVGLLFTKSRIFVLHH